MSDELHSEDTESLQQHDIGTVELFRQARLHAMAGGVPGLFAMMLQVASLMWLHTTLNYQYQNGGTTLQALKKLWNEGGVVRLYRGLLPALLLAPVTKFVDIAANAGCVWFLENHQSTAVLPLAVKTAAGSVCAGTFRILLMPLDAMKTMLQVQGSAAMPILLTKIRERGVGVLFHGAVASGSASTISHFPWFATYNYLDRALPAYDVTWQNILRNGFIGFTASSASAVVSNWVRVIKTAKQTSPNAVTYPQVMASIVSKDGVMGLFGRGLGTKILMGGVQGVLFTVLWKLGQQSWCDHSMDVDAHPPTPLQQDSGGDIGNDFHIADPGTGASDSTAHFSQSDDNDGHSVAIATRHEERASQSCGSTSYFARWTPVSSCSVSYSPGNSIPHHANARHGNAFSVQVLPFHSWRSAGVVSAAEITKYKIATRFLYKCNAHHWQRTESEAFAESVGAYRIPPSVQNPSLRRSQLYARHFTWSPSFRHAGSLFGQNSNGNTTHSDQ